MYFGRKQSGKSEQDGFTYESGTYQFCLLIKSFKLFDPRFLHNILKYYTQGKKHKSS